jgi:hypothetical protein
VELILALSGIRVKNMLTTGATAVNPQCTGKHPYRTATRAWRVVRKPRIWRGRRICRMLDVYRCRLCGAWHIGKHFKSARAHSRYEE